MNWNIDMIRSIGYDLANEMAEKKSVIKGHEVFFIDFGGYFGYSVLVFLNKEHMYYANDYELHHSGRTKVWIENWYNETMEEKLFTEDELMGKVASYDEYERKSYYARNYWIMQFEHLSIFGLDKEVNKDSFKFYCDECFCWVKDEEICKKAKMFIEHLASEYDRIKEDNEVFKEMVRKELANHEACYTCSYTDAMMALGMRFDDLSDEKKMIVLEELKRQIHEYN